MIGQQTQDFIERIHATACRMVISITGGGTAAISALLNVAGASRTILAADVPYSRAALFERLGGPVDNACSEATARALAMAAFQQAHKLDFDHPYELRGIGATASLVSLPAKRGPHRIHVAWQSSACTAVYSCELVKGRRSRVEEQKLAAELILVAAAEACGTQPVDVSTSTHEPIVKREKRAPPAWQELLLGRRDVVALASDGSTVDAPPPAQVLFPGAFRPLHQGHRRMAEIGAQKTGAPVTFELSIQNVDKPPLDFIEIDERLEQLAGQPAWLTRSPTFAEKASLAPGCTFIVGADTIARIADPQYYQHNTAQRNAALELIGELGCRFLIFGRQDADTFRTLDDVSIPPQLRSICESVPETEFREDVSSTELRSSRDG